MYTFGNVGIERRRGLLADGSGIKSFRTGWGDRTAWDWRHQRFHQEIFREKLTNLTFATITRDVRHSREAKPADVSLQSCRAGPGGKAHNATRTQAPSRNRQPRLQNYE